jgi:lysophospholipase L1-like esterase
MRRIALGAMLLWALVGCTGNLVSIGPGGVSPGAGCGAFPSPGRVTFQGTNGACLPATRLEAVQCDLNQPAIMVRGAGTPTERRNLGGTYRVPVRKLPPGAQLLATQDSTRIYRVPEAPASIWVDEGGTIDRWPALPSHVPWAGRQPGAFFIGDSITDGATPFIESALPDWTLGFDAVVGRGSNSGIAPAEAQGAAVPTPDVVVVELGTNDASPDAFAQNALQIMEALKDVPLVVWQTVHSPAEDVPEINETIRRIAASNPNTTIADWNHFVSDDMLVTDGVHPLSEHESAMADLVAPILKDWRGAVEGNGPAACLGSAT